MMIDTAIDHAADIATFALNRLISKLECLNAEYLATMKASVIVPPNTGIPAIYKLLADKIKHALCIEDKCYKSMASEIIESIRVNVDSTSVHTLTGYCVYIGLSSTDGGMRMTDYHTYAIPAIFDSVAARLDLSMTISNRYDTEPLCKMTPAFTKMPMDGCVGVFTVCRLKHGNVTALFGIATYDCLVWIYDISAGLPIKHTKGGASAIRFARIRQEKYFKFIARVKYLLPSIFIKDNRNLVSKILVVLGGSYDERIKSPDNYDKILPPIEFIEDGKLPLDLEVTVLTEEVKKRLLNRNRAPSIDRLRHAENIIKSANKDLIVTRIDVIKNALDDGKICSFVCDTEWSMNRVILEDSRDGQIAVKWISAVEIWVIKCNEVNSKQEDIMLISSERVVDWLANNYAHIGIELYLFSNLIQQELESIHLTEPVYAILKHQ